MRILLLSAICWLASVTVVSAATGDVLFVLGDNVNLRQGPNLESPVERQFNRGERLFELGRDGDWVEIGNEKTGPRLGWVHETLVSRVSPEVAQSKLKAADSEGEMLVLMRRMANQIDELSRHVQDLREECAGSRRMSAISTSEWAECAEAGGTTVAHAPQARITCILQIF